MKKYILITALILSNTTWAMEIKKKDAPVNAKDLKKIIHFLVQRKTNNKKDGMAVLDAINAQFGSRTVKANPVRGGFSPSTLFVIHPSKSKL